MTAHDVTRLQNEIQGALSSARCYAHGVVWIGNLEFQFRFTPADDFFGDPAGISMLYANKFSHFTSVADALAGVCAIVSARG